MCCVFQEWKERYGNQREDYTARNRSSHEMKETSYSDTVPPSNNRRKSSNSRSGSAGLLSKCAALITALITADICCLLNRGEIFSLWESGREGLHRAAAGRWTFRLQRGFSDRRPSGLRVWQVRMIKRKSDCALLRRSQTHLYLIQEPASLRSPLFSVATVTLACPNWAQWRQRFCHHTKWSFYSFSLGREWFSSSGSGAVLLISM